MSREATGKRKNIWTLKKPQLIQKSFLGFWEEKGAKKYLPEEQKVILTIPEKSSYCIGGVLLNIVLD